jgi:ring-1,2-phenylacetyl-CoA epoxidase subunit PaaB
MSKLRQNIDTQAAGEPLPEEPVEHVFEVFVQTKRSEPHVQVGSVNATDAQMALDYARETFGRRQACVHIWVVPREALVGTAYDEDFMERATERTYREARGYLHVKGKWERVRAKKDVDEYRKDDLKDAW